MIVHHELCFGCGQANLFGLQLEADAREDGTVAGRFFVKQDHQGARHGFAHDGILATVLAEAMALAVPGGRLSSLSVELRGAAPVGAFVDVVARVESRAGGRVSVSAVASGADRVEIAVARGELAAE